MNGFERQNVDNGWCPGCGNFGILELLKRAMTELALDKRRVVFVSGIGQAAKTPHYLDVNFFNGLHGRALPVATAIKAADPELIVVAEGGDGDMYGEGGNHFLAAARRNVNIVHLVHNNMVYGLTKGQASPTSRREFKTKVQVHGVHNEPFNPLTAAIALNASFVSRVYMGRADHAVAVIKQAFLHPGYALVDIFQPCVTFNKLNTYDWFEKNSYPLENHDESDRQKAFEKAGEEMPFALGVFYRHAVPTLEENLWKPYGQAAALHEVRHDAAVLQAEFDRL